MRRILAAFACLLALTALPAAAQQAYVDLEQRLNAEQLRETGLDKLSKAQLAALNRILRGEDEVQVAAAKAEAKAEVQAQRQQEAEHSALIGLNDQPIKSRLKGDVAGWEPGTEFELENGQRWKVLKGQMKLRKPLNAPEIVVVPGIAGRWFLQVDEDMPKARVYRID
ncbi:hypothetical protein J5837_09175 [Pseudoxanthomonas helianthi]|uniref:Secreted protein n=1 Tax=Pseudoxanthomonas helianthi TaxID=1453541 RepID=A0A941AUR9_9GAMM|nr:hypothetical protein [Pseudoxanthomonas helianthi]MBP3984587.1 hypothetical protein [Pseudoxanthomonas helianthi]